MSIEPRTDLGLPFSGPGATPRPWAHTLGALRRIQKFTLCTVRRDGRPHATPLLAIWNNDGMCFVTGPHEQKRRNLQHNPACILTAGTDSLTGFDHVVEGIAEQVDDPGCRDEIATAYEQAYGWHLTRADGTWHGMADDIRRGDVVTYVVRPSVVFAFGNGEPFSQTRYHFA